jgi:rod shape-determining protein MreB
MLQGLDRRLSEELKIRVWVAEDPMSCVARGAGSVLEDYDNLKHLLTSLERSTDGRYSPLGS